MPATRALGRLLALFLLSIPAASAAGLISQTLCNAVRPSTLPPSAAGGSIESWPIFNPHIIDYYNRRRWTNASTRWPTSWSARRRGPPSPGA